MFKGKIFSLEEYMDWYVKKHGHFDYFDTVEGFNIPGVNLKPFYDGQFNPLTKKEERILDLCRLESNNLETLVIISTFREQELDHELAHGLFYLDAMYRTEVKSIVKQIKPHIRRKFGKNLKERDYHPSTWIDEINSYSVEKRKLKWVPNFPEKAQLRKLFREYKEIYKK